MFQFSESEETVVCRVIARAGRARQLFNNDLFGVEEAGRRRQLNNNALFGVAEALRQVKGKGPSFSI